jgi:endoglucanase
LRPLDRVFLSLCFPLMACGVLLQAASAQSANPHELAFRRAGHLRRGINASNWFAQAPGRYTPERLRTYTTADDFVLMHRLGFDHIRLSIDADPLQPWLYHWPGGDAFVSELDRVVKEANAQQLAVIIDIHPEEKYKQGLLQGSENVGRFTSLWTALARHFAGSDPNLVFFELMNEPEQSDPYRWLGIEAEVTSAIRAVAPDHTIIATGAHWSGLQDLLETEPLADPNVIYTFHDYEPFPFSHQGATWTDARVIPLRNVPYPSTPDNVVPNEAQEPNARGKFFVEQYGLDRWGPERVDRTIAFAAEWGKEHNVPVYCGEFGVHKPYADPKARAAWVHDMRVTLEKYNIGWNMWDYQDNFGLVTKANGIATPDAALVEALGLHAAK